MHLDSAGAWALFPKIVDDMYDLTLDWVYRGHTFFKEYKETNVCDVPRVSRSSDEIDMLKKTQNRYRTLNNLRYSPGGRSVNDFELVIQRWDMDQQI